MFKHLTNLARLQVHYRSMASPTEYVLASSTKAYVEVFRRESDGWKLRTYGPGTTVDLTSVGCSLAVDDIYRKVFKPES